MAEAKSATIRGIFLRPGVSRNNRLYTPENIGKAVDRMQLRMAGSGIPITMATSHGAAYTDDALSTIGRVTRVEQMPNGDAAFEADIANTTAGRDVSALAMGGFIKPLSIRGAWVGDMEKVPVEGGDDAWTAPDLDISGIDFTHSPGVEGAQITSIALAESRPDAQEITESFDEVEFLETADAAAEATPDMVYADNGYQKDREKRLPINTANEVRAAMTLMNISENTKAYTAPQLARIKSRIKNAAKKLNIDVQTEAADLTHDLSEVLAVYTSQLAAAGHIETSISNLLAAEMANEAILALNSPNTRKPAEAVVEATTDDDMDGDNCMNCGSEFPEGSMYCPMCGMPVPQGETTNDEEPQMTEQETAAVTALSGNEEAQVADSETTETAPATDPVTPAAPVTLSEESMNAMAIAVATAVAAALKPVEAAPVATPVVETAPAAPVTEGSFTKEAVDEMLKAVAERAAKESRETTEREAVEAFRGGMEFRKGGSSVFPTAAGLSETDDPTEKEMSEMSLAEFRRFAGQRWLAVPAVQNMTRAVQRNHGFPID